jgi:hypothetical protein
LLAELSLSYSNKQLLPCAAKDLVLVRNLGSGTFGDVDLMSHGALPFQLAVKVGR